MKLEAEVVQTNPALNQVEVQAEVEEEELQLKPSVNYVVAVQRNGKVEGEVRSDEQGRQTICPIAAESNL